MEIRVRPATSGDFSPLGRILWDAFGGKLRFFLGDDPGRGARFFSGLLRVGAIRHDALRVAAIAETAEETAEGGARVVGVCLLRLPGAPGGSARAALALALRHFGWWRGLRAFAGLCLCDEPGGAAAHTATVSLLAVAAPVRGRGVGGALLRAVEEEARAAGARALALDVIENNPARRLYERLGFQSVRTHRLPRLLARVLGYRTYDHMEKPLTQK